MCRRRYRRQGPKRPQAEPVIVGVYEIHPSIQIGTIKIPRVNLLHLVEFVYYLPWPNGQGSEFLIREHFWICDYSRFISEVQCILVTNNSALNSPHGANKMVAVALLTFLHGPWLVHLLWGRWPDLGMRLVQCISTGVPRNLRVPPVVSEGSAGPPVLSKKN